MNAVQNLEAPLDLRALDSLRDSLDGDVEALTDVIGSYLDDAPQQLAELQRCIEQSDLPALARAAHTFKGTSQAFGARALVAACIELQRQTAADTAASIKDAMMAQLQLIRAESERVRASLAQYLKAL